MDLWIDSLFAAFALASGLLVLGLRAAYQNGVTDGYGFAREPRNPGYQRAGNYLKTFMGHRWPDLED